MKASFLAIFRKEILHIRRNRSILFLAVMMPLMQLTMYGFIDQTVHDIPTVVVDQDRSVQSRELMDRLRATKTFAIKVVTANPLVARTEIVAGRAGVGIVIPPDYHDNNARAASPPKILILIDGSDSIVSSGALAAANGVISNQNLELVARDPRAGVPLSAQPIILFNPEGRTANFIIPGLVAVILQMIAVVPAAGVDRARTAGHHGAAAQKSGPSRPVRVDAPGRVVPYLFVGLAETAPIHSRDALFLQRADPRQPILFVRDHDSVFVRAARARPVHFDHRDHPARSTAEGADTVFALYFLVRGTSSR